MDSSNNFSLELKQNMIINALALSSNESNDLKSTLTNILNFGIWIWDLDTELIFLSDEAFSIVQYDASNFDGTMQQVISDIIHPDSIELFKSSIDQALKSGVIPQESYRVKRSDDSVLWIQINGEVIRDEEGFPLRIAGTLFDVSKERLKNVNYKGELSFLESIMETLPSPVIYRSVDGILKFCNSAFAEFNGLEKNEIVGKTLFDLFPEDLAKKFVKIDAEIMERQGSLVEESSTIHKDGTMHDILISRATHVDQFGKTIGLIGVFQDITEKKNNEKRNLITQRIRNVFWKMNQSLMDYENEKMFFNQVLMGLQKTFANTNRSSVIKVDKNHLSFLSVYGYPEEALKDQTFELDKSFLWKDTNGSINKPLIVNDLENIELKGYKSIIYAQSHEKIRSSLIIPVQIDGVLKWIISLDSSQNNVFNTIDLFGANFIQEEIPIFYRIFDLTRKTLNLSRYDTLTGLMNRRYFETVFTDRTHLAERNNDQLTLINFDLDGVKKINDNCGHHCGDAYLQSFAKLIRKNLRASDCIGRLGGDEFAVLLSGTDNDALIAKMEALRSEFKSLTFGADDKVFTGSFSYGIACYPIDSRSRFELQVLADERMYHYKKKYKGK